MPRYGYTIALLICRRYYYIHAAIRHTPLWLPLPFRLMPPCRHDAACQLDAATPATPLIDAADTLIIDITLSSRRCCRLLPVYML